VVAFPRTGISKRTQFCTGRRGNVTETNPKAKPIGRTMGRPQAETLAPPTEGRRAGRNGDAQARRTVQRGSATAKRRLRTRLASGQVAALQRAGLHPPLFLRNEANGFLVLEDVDGIEGQVVGEVGASILRLASFGFVLGVGARLKGLAGSRRGCEGTRGWREAGSGSGDGWSKRQLQRGGKSRRKTGHSRPSRRQVEPTAGWR